MKHYLSNLFLKERFVIFLVIVNTCVIFAQCYPESPSWLEWVDALLTLAFVFEAAVKIAHFGMRRYWESGWNRFDFIITLLSLPSLLQFFDVFSTFSAFSAILALRLFRLLRLLKTLRIMHVFPGMKSIVDGIAHAAKASYIIVFVFILCIVILSLTCCVLFGQFDAPYFQTPTSSLYTMFRLFTVEGWYEIPDTLAAEAALAGSTVCPILIKVLFVFILFAGGIIGMSFINSIIVDAMVSDNNDNLEREVKALTDKVDSLTDKLDALTEEIKTLKK